MKRELFVRIFSISARALMFFIVLVLTTLSSPSILAQEDKGNKKEVEEATLISPSLEFVCVQKGDMSTDLKARLQAKVNGSNKKLPHLRVTFKSMAGDEEKVIGHAITDVMGRALLNVKSDAIPVDESGQVNLKAEFAGNKAIEEVSEELSFKKVNIAISPVPGDTVYSVKIKLSAMNGGSVVPVANADLGVYVKRFFNPLKVADATTDENGEAYAVVPFDLPGDDSGNITVLARLDEHEVYGNAEASLQQKWGLPVSIQKKDAPRALWSAHPPIWMLVTFIILITVVWGHYIVIIFELFRLRKEEPGPAQS
ncbi:MAG TPA: hypothetical protein PLQ93_04740 [Bacteroidia bacterium]|nr:hypothetical protein [Bacteroidia bacterium]